MRLEVPLAEMNLEQIHLVLEGSEGKFLACPPECSSCHMVIGFDDVELEAVFDEDSSSNPV